MSELFYVDHALPNMVSLKITEREGKTGEIRRRKAIGPIRWQPVVNEKVHSALWLVLGF